ncbi:MAG TPA: cysteine synthase A [Candidatus Scatosoma pullistercoris]|uniref:cysteine synthase n=1 Tax=Candidatus Scatosoma pullistercoris TaxID=2840934 RepID=A0A9D1MEH3_9FIRM|nr:cysteine synthase A [Candidatus Scatosoma pullistercoris]
MYFGSIAEAVGRTPLVALKNIGRECALQAQLLAKVESMNPTGSGKDRAAAEMLREAEESGRLDKDTLLIEPTSGNTGIGLAALAAAKGLSLVIVMPDTMSGERRLMISAFGAKLILTEGRLGMQGAVDRAEQLHREVKNSLIVGQFVNPANPAAHYKTTGPEIWEDTEGCVDAFVAGVGTGGTVTGVGRFLKEKNPGVRILAVEPASSPVLSGGKSGLHSIQGIGAGFVPDNFDRSVCDEILTVTDEDAYSFAGLLAKKEGILAGVSSGAALAAAVRFASRRENAGKRIVVLLPDTGDRYLSCGLFA